MQVVQLMEERGVLVRRGGNGSQTRFALNGQQEALVILLCCFLWPFIDSLWALGNALFTLQLHTNGGTCPEVPRSHPWMPSQWQQSLQHAP